MYRILAVFLIIVAAIAAWWFFQSAYQANQSGVNIPTTTPAITSFADCAAAGYPVAESYPRQCRTPDGRVFAEEIQQNPTYQNASADLIKVTLPYPGAVTGKEFAVKGEARGGWYFEASFPVEVKDKNGQTLVSVPAQAEGDWMTSDFVPFTANIKIPDTYQGPATIILHKDNPSGMPENEASVSFPITIEY